MKIISIGEALVDMLIKTDPETGSTSGEYQRFAGGAPANVAVAAAKLGGESILISRIGDDHFGRFVTKTLNEYQVNTQHVVLDSRRKTALAFVVLDEQGERAFDFYIDNAAHTALCLADYPDIAFNSPVIAHLCSGSVASASLAEGTYASLEKFRANNSIVSLDINYRHAFWGNEPNTSTADAPAAIDKLAQQSDVIKASKEELLELFPENDIEAVIQNWLAQRAKLVLITDGGNPVEFITHSFRGTYPTPATNVVDTTAAGDAFIGGFLNQVAANNDSLQSFSQWVEEFENVLLTIDFATRCGAHAVARYGAYVSLPTLSDIPPSKKEDLQVG